MRRAQPSTRFHLLALLGIGSLGCGGARDIPGADPVAGDGPGIVETVPAPESGAPAAAVATATPPQAADDPCATAEGDEAPRSLVCSGLYQSALAGRPAPGVREFFPAGELWADGASKRRYIQLPPGTRIDSTDMDAWKFPVGTKFWKEFNLDGRKIETRFLWKRSEAGWVWATYRWSDDETRSDRLDEGDQLEGTSYEVPRHSECMDCHAGRADTVLGFNAVSLSLRGASGLTLTRLAEEDLLTTRPDVTEGKLPDDGNGRAAGAIGWLHANCGHCHAADRLSMASLTGLHMRLSFAHVSGAVPPAKTPVYETAVGIPSGYTPPGFSEGSAVRVVAGEPGRSVLFLRARSRDFEIQMPPVGTHAVDPVAMELLTDWIRGLQ